MVSSEQYPINMFWSDDDEGFIAVAPDLPGCSAFGETRAEAATEVYNAIEAWIGAATKAGNPIPEPSRSQPEYVHSGKVLVRMPKILHAQLAERAKIENVSLNSWMVHLLSVGASSTATYSVASRPDNFSESLVAAFVDHTHGVPAAIPLSPRRDFIFYPTAIPSDRPVLSGMRIGITPSFAGEASTNAVWPDIACINYELAKRNHHHEEH